MINHLNKIEDFNKKFLNYSNVLYLDYDSEIDNLDLDKILKFLSIKIDDTKKIEIINQFKNEKINDRGIHGQHISFDSLEECNLYKRLIKLKT